MWGRKDLLLPLGTEETELGHRKRERELLGGLCEHAKSLAVYAGERGPCCASRYEDPVSAPLLVGRGKDGG